MSRLKLILISTVLGLGASACGGGGNGNGVDTPEQTNPTPQTPVNALIKGKVQGLADNTGLVLLNNGVGGITVDTDGAFTFVDTVKTGDKYRVSVKTQPTPAEGKPAQRCGVAKGRGTVGYSDVDDVVVSCESAHEARVNAGTEAEASYSAPKVIYANGDGLAVWEADLGDVKRLMASFYRSADATDRAWQTETIIAEARTNGGWSFMTDLQLVADGNFAVAWKTSDNQIAVRLYRDGAWGTPTTLTTGDNVGHYTITGNGTSKNVMAVWQQGDEFYSRVFTLLNTSWTWLGKTSAAVLMFSRAPDTPKALMPALAGNADSFRLAWNISEDIVNGQGQSVLTKSIHYANFSLTSDTWGVNNRLERVDNDVAPRVVSNGEIYGIAYQNSLDSPFVRLHLDTVANQTCQDLNISKPVSDIHALSANSDFSMGWRNSDGTLGFTRCVISKVQGKNVVTPTIAIPLESTYRSHTLTATTDGTDHVYAWLQDEADGGVSVQTSTYARSGTNANTWAAASLGAATAQTALAGHDKNIEQLSRVWNADKKTFLPRLNAQSLAQTAQSVQPQRLELVANAYRERLALWEQPTVNATSGTVDTPSVYARVEVAGEWKDPVVVPAVRDDVRVVSGGGDLFAVWIARGDNPGLWARHYDRTQGQWLDAAKVADLAAVPAARDLLFAANDRGAMIAWRQPNGNGTTFDLYALTLQNGAWGTAQRIDGDVGAAIAAASDGVGYALAWTKKPTNGRRQVLAQMHDGLTWGTPRVAGDIDPETVDANHTAITAQIAVASSGADYAVAWIQDNNVSVSVATRRVDATANQYQIVLLDTQTSLAQPRIAAMESNYTVTWLAGDHLQARQSSSVDGTQWGDIATLATLPTNIGYDLRGDGEGVMVTWQQNGELLGVLKRDTASAWPTAATLSTQANVIDNAVDTGALRAHAAWITRGDSADKQGVWAKTGF